MVTHSSYSAIVSTRRMTTESLESDGRGVDGEAGIIELESIIDAVIPPTESSRRRSGSIDEPQCAVTSSFNDPAPKVFPSWIEFLDDVEFPLARPSLYRLLACDRVDHIAVLLVPD